MTFLRYIKMGRQIAALLISASCALAGHAEPLKRLNDTELFNTIAHDCAQVDLSTWTHPTRKVLEKHKVPKHRVAICNGGLYPIFYVHFRYDPLGRTNDFFFPLYEEMRRANGSHPLAFVDEGVIVELEFSGPRKIKLRHEMYTE